jgi:hypothetical protein
MTLNAILFVASFACFVAAAIGVESKVGLVPLGLALCVLTQLL